MERRVIGPVREPSPCMGCTREMKAAGCHDRCKDFKLWRQNVETIKQKRREYDRMSRRKNM